MIQQGIFRAFHITERLRLSSVNKLFPEKSLKASGTELIFEIDDDAYVILFNFGSVVFFNVEPSMQGQILKRLEETVPPKDQLPNREEFQIKTGELVGVDFGTATVPHINIDNITLIALVLAQSTALDHYEQAVDEVVDKWGTLSSTLHKTGKTRIGNRDFFRFIGFCIHTKQRVIGSTNLLDVPDSTWDDPLLETLYVQISDQFELHDRYRILEHKLRFVQEALTVLSNQSYSRRTLYLEWAIVILIAIEVVLFIYELMRPFS